LKKRFLRSAVEDRDTSERPSEAAVTGVLLDGEDLEWVEVAIREAGEEQEHDEEAMAERVEVDDVNIVENEEEEEEELEDEIKEGEEEKEEEEDVDASVDEEQEEHDDEEEDEDDDEDDDEEEEGVLNESELEEEVAERFCGEIFLGESEEEEIFSKGRL
jgi:hypothetical protein